MKPAKAKVKRGSIEERIRHLQAQVDAKKKKEQLRATIAQARRDLAALKISRR